jgi:hypothetical protein
MADLHAFEIANAIEARHSSRVPLDSKRVVPDRDLQRILRRWAPIRSLDTHCKPRQPC